MNLSLKPTKLSRKGMVQFVFFNAGGLAFFVIGYATFTLLYGLFHWSWLPAKIVGDSLGWSANFAIQYFLAFRDERKGQHPRVEAANGLMLALPSTINI
jgi:putative flippase GtrA